MNKFYESPNIYIKHVAKSDTRGKACKALTEVIDKLRLLYPWPIRPEDIPFFNLPMKLTLVNFIVRLNKLNFVKPVGLT